MDIVRLGPGEEARLRTIRLKALHDAPNAFATTAAEAAARTPESWSTQISVLPTFVAVRDGQDVGMVRFAPDEESTEMGWLISMWVSPEIRGEGVGGALIDAIVDFATSTGVARLALDVADQNAPAISLYASKGFVPTGEVRTFEAPRQHVHEHRRVLKLR
ncbi:MAG: GNAT family N-acetyltransferase [bacterium]|nr:GNAT family N-acetyltransferase [bacterium]MCP5065849.1 GNAT family N-acetyltransferase [bacterium]